ncbi:hypothetical protein SERLA73DRAFT_80659 [Serpula lacrymans var. lacrymans S7.3]|uniref:Uncharacterized protein n=1 Tax=Serpula lacrymans var. lacrymans (strain S7.3) TaxID=936435 RepID=F8QK39_SERL3|nr:hypothetical protein SERLA73DRAFT_80659 [Serpula lacrymans var. lacrymans S7.3]
MEGSSEEMGTSETKNLVWKGGDDKPPQQRLPSQYQRYQPHYQQNQNYPPPQHQQTVPQTETLSCTKVDWHSATWNSN